MNKILFIGRFNETTKRIHGELSESFQIQLCSDNVAIATRMLGMYGPDLVLLNLEGLSENHVELFRELSSGEDEIPVITIGSETEKAPFADFYQQDCMHHMNSPVESEALQTEIRRVLAADMEAIGDFLTQDATQRKYVLLVDDSPVILRGMKQMLEDTYRVGMVTSGEQALKAIHKQKPDAIILDYEMPGCNGKETLEMIRAEEDTRDIPVVFLTGHGDADHIRSVLDLNPSAYFLKPPKAEKIREILGQLI